MAESPLLREADRWIGRYRTLVLNALTVGQKAVSASRVRAALEAKNTTAAELSAMVGLVEIESMLREGMPTLALNLLAAAGNVAGREIPAPPFAPLKRRAAVARPLKFDKKNPQAILWAERHAASLIVEIGEEARRAVRRVIVAGLSEGIAPAAQAQIIRQSVGLTERYAAAVVNLHQRLMESPGKFVRAGRMVFRVPASGMPAVERRQAVARYADRLVKSRATMIARTETIKASSEGQHQMWQQARAKGLLDASIRRQWITTVGACPICAGLDGETRRLDESFSGGVFIPPAHPGCRCTTALAYPS